MTQKRKFISLGADCQVAYHIRRIDPFAEKHIFDFLITPETSLINLISSSFQRFLLKNDLSPRFKPDGHPEVIDTYNQIEFLHDFPSMSDSDVAATQEKFNYLAKKFMNTLRTETDTIFVRRWHYVDNDPTDQSMHQLLSVLQKFCPSAELLYLHQFSDRTPLIQGPLRCGFIPQVIGDWRGNEEAWTFYLKEFYVNA